MHLFSLPDYRTRTLLDVPNDSEPNSEIRGGRGVLHRDLNPPSPVMVRVHLTCHCQARISCAVASIDFKSVPQ